MYNQIQSFDSVALGIRLYEESKNPADHALNGNVKSITDINAAISLLRTKKPNAKFYVFCSHHSPEIDKLDLPPDSFFVTSDEGFIDPVDSLWLLAQCKHHILQQLIYWWAHG